VNGVHDMGGMHGLGPIVAEVDEPVFHARWEARTLALTLAMGAWGAWNLDASRHTRELIPGPDYLRMSYYEKWYAGLVELMVTAGLVTREEVQSGRPAAGTVKATPRLAAGRVAGALRRGGPSTRPGGPAASFGEGARVRARTMNPTGHTRLPRYARGKVGVVERDRGTHVFPDTNAHGLGESPQHLYSVRFSARELWGDGAGANDAVYLDLWDDHLEPA
jgi:nitrile hydratase beta subunit